jgi:hypothetical protein
LNPDVPRGAALLLDFIGNIEAPSGYGTIYRNRQHLLVRPLTEMSLAQVLASQPGWAQESGSSAAGRYQLIQITLREMMRKLRLSARRPYDADLQDLLGYALLQRRGYHRFMGGEMSPNTFALELAKEWASIPVVAPVQGAHRPLVSGESYYSGDNRNCALVAADTVIDLLDRLRGADTY